MFVEIKTYDVQCDSDQCTFSYKLKVFGELPPPTSYEIVQYLPAGWTCLKDNSNTVVKIFCDYCSALKR
jgi:hypothetical protein